MPSLHTLLSLLLRWLSVARASWAARVVTVDWRAPVSHLLPSLCPVPRAGQKANEGPPTSLLPQTKRDGGL